MSRLSHYRHYASSLIRYFIRAKTKYDIHSPFVVDFIQYVLEDRRLYYAFPELNRMRHRLLHDSGTIQVTDLGAGSKVNSKKTRQVKDIAAHSAISESTAQWLFKMVIHYQPKTILELGTSLGISTIHLAAGTHQGQVFTIEGCPETAAVAQQTFNTMGMSNLHLLVGAFAQVLPPLLTEMEKLDLVFIDGDHKKGACSGYFDLCLSKIHEKSIVVIADIHWSPEMEDCWEEIKQNQSVRLSIDLWHLGILFFDPALMTPQAVTLIPAVWKPWRIGLFGSK
jgi:predicted O-methyltransferase YrrM